MESILGKGENVGYNSTVLTINVYTYVPCSGKKGLNPSPDDRILNGSSLRVFADDKMYAIKNIKFVYHRMENIVGKGENAGYQHFLLFPKCFLPHQLFFYTENAICKCLQLGQGLIFVV